jgi:hypothetical protein
MTHWSGLTTVQLLIMVTLRMSHPVIMSVCQCGRLCEYHYHIVINIFSFLILLLFIGVVVEVVDNSSTRAPAVVLLVGEKLCYYNAVLLTGQDPWVKYTLPG